MDTSEIGVIVGGVTLIGFVLWYFFGEREKAVAEVAASGVQEIKVTVKGGYAPDVIVVKQGSPCVWTSSGRDKLVHRAGGLRRLRDRSGSARLQNHAHRIHARQARRVHLRLRHEHGARKLIVQPAA
jgi:hypothetical protein